MLPLCWLIGETGTRCCPGATMQLALLLTVCNNGAVLLLLSALLHTLLLAAVVAASVPQHGSDFTAR